MSRTLLQSLSETDRHQLGECLRAAVEGPFFPEWEFFLLFGFERDELRAVLEAWPDPPLSDGRMRAMLRATLSQLQGYPHGAEAELERRTGLGEAGLQELAARLG